MPSPGPGVPAGRINWAWEVLALTAFLCLIGLFRNNVTENEVSKFTDAMVYADPAWVPDLFPPGAEPGRRQWLFQTLAAPLLSHGFLLTSIVGRLVAYLLLAAGLISLKRTLGLKGWLLIPVVFMMDRFPYLAAREWIIPGVEPKVFSYGLVLLAFGCILRPTPSLTAVALLLGLATSFHVLVGLYATFSLVILILGQGLWRGRTLAEGVRALSAFLLASAFALRPLAVHLSQQATDPVPGRLSSSFIYVFLRDPHHLDPASWPADWWMAPAIYLTALLLSGWLLRSRGDAQARRVSNGLLLLTLGSLIPFVLGLLIAPFDHQGRLLQYYPFRFGDVMAPLITYLMVTLSLQLAWAKPWVRWSSTAACAALALSLLPGFFRQLRALPDYPGPAQGITADWRDITTWIRHTTPPGSLFITPPRSSTTFPWLARRRMLGTFKQMTLSGGLQEWHQRMSAMADWSGPWPMRGWAAASWLEERYLGLDTEQTRELMQRYGASYFLTRRDHPLDLPLVYANPAFALYAAP